MHKGDRIKDTLTGSEWTIEQVWATDPGNRMRWHRIVSDRGATRRILTGELEERYEIVRRTHD
jgi:hypothetical protein